MIKDKNGSIMTHKYKMNSRDEYWCVCPKGEKPFTTSLGIRCSWCHGFIMYNGRGLKKPKGDKP